MTTCLLASRWQASGGCVTKSGKFAVSFETFFSLLFFSFFFKSDRKDRRNKWLVNALFHAFPDTLFAPNAAVFIYPVDPKQHCQENTVLRKGVMIQGVKIFIIYQCTGSSGSQVAFRLWQEFEPRVSSLCSILFALLVYVIQKLRINHPSPTFGWYYHFNFVHCISYFLWLIQSQSTLTIHST